MKNKKDLIYIIVIVLCALVIVGESIYIFKDKTPSSKGNNEEKIIYTGRRYLKENIVYDVPKDFSVQADIYNEDNLMLVKLTSLEKIIVNSKLIVEYYDEKDNLVKTDESNIGILGVDEVYAFNSLMPLMKDNVYAGKVVISLEKEYLENDVELYNKSLLKFNYETDTDQTTNITTVSLNAVNPFETINYYDGYIVAYKDDVVQDVGYISFENNKFEDNKIINSASLNPKSEDGILKPVSFDKIEIIINNLY